MRARVCACVRACAGVENMGVFTHVNNFGPEINLKNIKGNIKPGNLLKISMGAAILKHKKESVIQDILSSYYVLEIRNVLFSFFQLG